MPNRILISVLFLSLVFPRAIFSAEPEMIFNPNFLVSDDQMTDTASLSKVELDALLSMGALANYTTTDLDGVSRSASDIIWNASQTFSLNPRFLLVLLQREQSLVEDDRPSQDQLDWAMGYAVCDDCRKDDPQIQKYKGFANQVYYAAKRIRESFLTDLEVRGSTINGFGPGIVRSIDQATVIPANYATSVLYSYTPHLHGNQNFVRIWNRWFSGVFLDGALLQDKISGGIWLIQDGLRRPITSHAAFVSRFNPKSVVQVGPSTLEEYPVGTPIQFPNYSLIRSPRGTVYLVVDEKRRGFTSQEAFRAKGFSPDEITDVSWDDLNAYKEGEPITTETVYPQGTLLQDKQTGGIFFVRNGVKQPLLSREILTVNFPSPTFTKVSTNDLNQYPTGSPLPFPDGTLVAAHGSPDVFVISDGQRRPISNEMTFLTYGWNWNQIVWTNERSVLLHPLGDILNANREETMIQITAQP